MVSHLLCVVLALLVAYFAQPGSSLFSWHPTLMTIGFSVFMFQGLLVFNKQSSIVNSHPRHERVTWHGLFQVLGLLCSVGGFLAIWQTKNAAGKPHFTSNHALCGVICLGWAAMEVLAGIGLRLTPSATWRNLGVSQRLVKAGHMTFGALLWLTVTCALLGGLSTSWGVSTISGAFWYVCVGIVALQAVIIVMQVVPSVLGLFKS